MLNNDILLKIYSELRQLNKAFCCSGGGGGTTTIPTIENYQPLDCEGDEVGDVLDVVPVVQQGPVDTHLCEGDITALAEAIATAIGGGGGASYNNNIQAVTTPLTTFDTATDLPPGIHSIAYSVIAVTDPATDFADVTIDGVTIRLPHGYNNYFEVSTILGNDIVVEDTSTARVIFTTVTA